MTTNTVSLVPRRERGWRMGFANMLAKENVAWWHTRRWWIQCLIALSILNGTFALNMMDVAADHGIDLADLLEDDFALLLNRW